MAAPKLNEGWITLMPYKAASDSRPKNRFMKGYHIQAVLNTDHIELDPDATVAWLSGSGGGTYFQTSLIPNPSNPGGTFTGSLYGLLKTAGDIEFTFTVTDSKGQTAGETFTVRVYEYFSPTISGVEVFRCSANGTESEDGGFVSAKADIKYSDMDGAITLVDHYVEFRDTGSTESVKTDIESGVPVLLGGGNVTPTRSYYLRIYARDSTYVSRQFEILLSTANAEFNIMEGGGGAAFGRLARREGVLDSAWDISSDGGIFASVTEQPDGSYASAAYMDADGNIHADGNIDAGGTLACGNAVAENAVSAASGEFSGSVLSPIGEFETLNVSVSLEGTDAAGKFNNLQVIDTLNIGGELSANGGIAGVTNYESAGVEELTGGKWIDGKPIYRYVLRTTTTLTGANGKIGDIPADVDTVVNMHGTWIHSDNNWFPLPHLYYRNLNNNIGYYVSRADNGIYLQVGSAYSGTKTVIVIVEYTKSTD